VKPTFKGIAKEKIIFCFVPGSFLLIQVLEAWMLAAANAWN
jgi:hypothetical protein